jgi:hypothetical protein
MVDGKTRSLASVNIQKLPQLEEKTCPLGIDHDKYHLVLKLQLSSQLHDKKQPMKLNQLDWGQQ